MNTRVTKDYLLPSTIMEQMTVGKKTSDQLDGEIEIDASNALISEIPPLIYF